MNFSQSICNGYIMPTSIAIGSGEAIDVRCVCDTVKDFKDFLDATEMELRYEGLITYEKASKMIKVYKGNNEWHTIGESEENVDTSNLVTLTQLSEQLSNHYTKFETDNKISEEIAKLSDYVTKSELNTIISQINALRSDVDKLLQNNGGTGESEKLYYNPTITVENNRAVFREDGYEERFLITHVENKNDPNYKGSVQVKGSDGYDYYVLLTDNAQSTNSKFRYNNLIPSHGGWMSFENKANQTYKFIPDRTYPYRNNFNFTDTVENVDGSVNPEV